MDSSGRRRRNSSFTRSRAAQRSGACFGKLASISFLRQLHALLRRFQREKSSSAGFGRVKTVGRRQRNHCFSMSSISTVASAGIALPEATCTWKCPNCESVLYERAAPQQAFDLVDPALSQTVRAGAKPLNRAKRSRSPQGRGSASTDEGQRMHKVQKTEETIQQRLSRTIAAATQALQASRQAQQASAQAIRAQQERRRQHANARKWSNANLHEEEWMLQALRDDGRQRALAHVGISSTATAPDGKPWGKQRIDALVGGWAITYQTVLTGTQESSIAARFGHDFISFLDDYSNQVYDMERFMGLAEPLSLAHTLLNMSWTERDSLMAIIDGLRGVYDKPKRRGARTAYLACFGGTSWKKEKRWIRRAC